ncbi:TadE/TadG family type IV pilus assembly protein [Caproiciproducens galactitolivorans]|uniref:TadE-like protein n=1 Tax=Caproiciproducens galactitolivorans TaxID=642589 RepID=A0A4Z0YDA4_9FIRM|nr:TadE/TadG family type IV pilus assembly protein [Caproiciproducens galactitolivorans]TGJ77405.1 TadE-like protein [Caproiciproducens galactitolivorans]
MSRNGFLKMYGERGQGLVEFALVLPVLLIILGAAVDLGRMINYKIILQNAASDSVRSMKQESDLNPDVIKSKLYEKYGDQLDFSQFQVRSSGGDVQRKYYTYHANSWYGFVDRTSYYDYFDATISVNYRMKMATPVMAMIAGEAVTLSSTFTGQVYINGYNG